MQVNVLMRLCYSENNCSHTSILFWTHACSHASILFRVQLFPCVYYFCSENNCSHTPILFWAHVLMSLYCSESNCSHASIQFWAHVLMSLYYSGACSHTSILFWADVLMLYTVLWVTIPIRLCSSASNCSHTFVLFQSNNSSCSQAVCNQSQISDMSAVLPSVFAMENSSSTGT